MSARVFPINALAYMVMKGDIPGGPDRGNLYEDLSSHVHETIPRIDQRYRPLHHPAASQT